MNYKMTYPEFLKAAIKHNSTCDHLRQAIETLESDTQIKALTLNLYYLSGYIIECAIKFGIYRDKGDQAQSIRQIAQSQGKAFSQKIFKHKFVEFVEYDGYLEEWLAGIVPIHDKAAVSPSI
jgi:hypothetical protein